MVATVLLYSGIENPRWTVPPALAAQVTTAIEGMAELHQACPPPGGLGYAGIVVSVPDHSGGERSWTFANGIAVSDQRCFADTDRKIEKMVLQSGREYIDATLLADILR